MRVNRRLARMFRAESSELTGCAFLDLVHPEDRSAPTCDSRNCHSTRCTTSAASGFAGATTRWCGQPWRSHRVSDDDTDAAGVLHLPDLSDLVKAEERLGLVTAGLDDGVVAFDPVGGIVDANPAAVRLLGPMVHHMWGDGDSRHRHRASRRQRSPDPDRRAARGHCPRHREVDRRRRSSRRHRRREALARDRRGPAATFAPRTLGRGELQGCVRAPARRSGVARARGSRSRKVGVPLAYESRVAHAAERRARLRAAARDERTRRATARVSRSDPVGRTASARPRRRSSRPRPDRTRFA